MTKLEQAREKVRNLQFGTKEWESAMGVVRTLVDEANTNTDFGELNAERDGKWWN